MNFRLSILGSVVLSLIAIGRDAAAANGGKVTTTVYVTRHFEVRDHDQPVKYLFNADDRVARVTGSLSSRDRIQRLRLQMGWNLISLAVTTTNVIGQLEQFDQGPVPLVSALYRWRRAARDFDGVSPGQNVEAGAVLWLRTATNALVSVVGSYSEPAPVALEAGGGYITSPGLEHWSPELPVGVITWRFDASAGSWLASFCGALESVGDVPPTLAPGDAIFIQTDEAGELTTPERAARVLFYHPDHLGSAAALSDAHGEAVENTACYPYGALRHRHRSRAVDAHYGFTEKEQDRETGLHYFEARYVVSPLGRFPSFDPLLQNMEALEAAELKKLLVEPAKLNPFAYALNNPVRYVDPDGREARPRPRVRSTPPPQRQPRPGQPARPAQAAPLVDRRLGKELTLRLGPPGKRPGELPADSFHITPRHSHNPTGVGNAGREPSVPMVTDIQVTRLADDATMSMFRAQQDVQAFESVRLIIPGKDGKEFRLQMENVIISSFSVSGHAGEVFENLTFSAGKLSFHDPDRPAPTSPSREQWDLEPGRGQ